MDINSFVDQAVRAGKTRQEALDYLKSKGYVKYEEKTSLREKLSSITPTNVLTGVGKGLLSTVKGASSLGEKTLGRLVGAYKGGQTSAEKLIPEKLTEARGTGEQIGKTAEQIGEFFVPGSASLKIGEAASLASKASGAGKLISSGAKLLGTGLAEGVLGTGQSAIQSGNLGKKELGVGAVSLVAPAAISIGGKAISATSKALMPAKDKAIEYIYKAIKPSLGSQATKQSIDTFNNKALNAFDTIRQNKDILQFPDNAGDLVNRLPENRAELLDAIGKTKTKLYTTWNGLEQQANGAKFSPSATLSKLEEVIGSKKYSPEVRKYAENLKPQIEELVGESPEVIDARIADLNSSLGSFYSGRVDKSKAQVDASVADALREELDNMVLNSTGEGVKGLRNQYSSIKAIEKDVVRQVKNEMKKADKGLLDFTDIFTGGDLVSGVLTLNPAQIARGAVGRGWKELYKYLNDPNRYVRKTFELLEKGNVTSDLGNYLKNIKPGLTIEDVSKQPLKAKGEILKSNTTNPKNFKTAEDYVKAQGETVYRGGQELSPNNITNSGISVSTGKNVAADFAKQKGGSISENIISKYAKIIDYKDVPGVKFKNINDYSPELDTGNKQIWKDLEIEYQKAVDYAKQNGYDGVKLPLEGETRIINPDIIKTKSQLISEWNKANGKTKLKSTPIKSLEVVAKTIPENLEKSITKFSKEKPQHFTKVLKTYVNDKYVRELKENLSKGYSNSNQGSLYGLLNNKDIFNKYPKLMNFDVIFDNKVKGGAYINVEKEKILIDPAYLKGYIDGLPNILKHEVQHAKDFYDLGKSIGGSPDMFLNDFKAMRFAFNDIKNRAMNYKDLVTVQELKELNYAISQMEKGYRPAKYLIDKYIEPESYKLYLRLWGENNARLKSFDVRKKVPDKLLIKDLDIK